MSTATPVRDRPTAPGASGPHPRIRARRAEVVRDAGRRRLRRIKIVLLVVAVVVWAQVALQSSLLDVDEVQVRGIVETSEAEVLDAAGVAPGDPMVSVDPGGVADRVGALPWVDEVRVTRSWPGTLGVVVTERRAVAAAPRGTGWALVDRTGRVLRVDPERPDLVGLDVTGAGAPGSVLADDGVGLVEVVAAIPSASRRVVDWAGEDPDGLHLVLEDETVVRVGAEEVDAGLTAALAVHEHLDDAGEGCVIDARVPSAPVLTAESTCA